MNQKRNFLILHGWGGSGPEHWQSWLANRLDAKGESVRFPSLPEPDAPRLEPWLKILRAERAAFEPDAFQTVVCHSLAVLLWLHYANDPALRPVDLLLLVAPPGPSASAPEIESFYPVPIDPAALARSSKFSRLICTDADPYCPERADLIYGKPLGMETIKLPPEAAHINTDSGYGPWPQMEEWILPPIDHFSADQ
jgi:predicted alpha/beta hydrolase family esterase